MKMNLKIASLVLVWAGCSIAFAKSPVLSVTADKADCLYRCGETTTFTVLAKDGNGQPAVSGTVQVRLDNFGDERQLLQTFDLAKGNPFRVSGKLEKPGFLRATLSGKGYKSVVFGTGYEPEKITQGVPCPADFDAFWAEAARKLEAEVPLDPQVTPFPAFSSSAADAFRVSFATAGGRRVYGYLSVPKDASKAPFPVRVTVPGAGCGGFANKMSSAPDAICLFLSVFPFEPDPDQKVVLPKYIALNKESIAKYKVNRYCTAGIAVSREAYFYYPVILGMNRAVNWVAARPDVDKKHFTYSGTSQGGGFGFYLCGLNKNFTKGCIFVPAITDLLGFKKGRQSGWPLIVENQAEKNKEAATRNAPYFDAANFAARIRIPVRVVVGFADTTCSPCAVYSGYNAIPSTDKKIFHGIGMGHGVFGSFYYELGVWQKSK